MQQPQPSPLSRAWQENDAARVCLLWSAARVCLRPYSTKERDAFKPWWTVETLDGEANFIFSPRCAMSYFERNVCAGSFFTTNLCVRRATMQLVNKSGFDTVCRRFKFSNLHAQPDTYLTHYNYKRRGTQRKRYDYVAITMREWLTFMRWLHLRTNFMNPPILDARFVQDWLPRARYRKDARLRQRCV